MVNKDDARQYQIKASSESEGKDGIRLTEATWVFCVLISLGRSDWFRD